MGGSIGSTVGRAVSGVTTLGLSEAARAGLGPNNILSKGLQTPGMIATGGLSNGYGKPGGSGLSAPAGGGQTSPMDMLTQTGGAPLLMDIALGADVGTALMGYFGVNGSNSNFDQWTTTLSPQDAEAVRSLHVQLSQIAQNTNMQNQAVQKLANDYPNIMSQKIQQYSDVADPYIQKMMGQAMDQIAAKQAAGGGISSGATVQAAAEAGAKFAGDKLNYATGMANQDFGQQLSIASGLQSFQQKMLGQGATQGFSAIQNALQRNNENSMAQAGYQFKADQYNQEQQNGMYGALGGLAGTVVGGMVGGLPGMMIGKQVGGLAGGGAPRLNAAPDFGSTGQRSA